MLRAIIIFGTHTFFARIVSPSDPILEWRAHIREHEQYWIRIARRTRVLNTKYYCSLEVEIFQFPILEYILSLSSV